MPEELNRKEIIASKLKTVKQNSNRKLFIDNLPNGLKQTITGSNFIISPRSDELLTEIFKYSKIVSTDTENDYEPDLYNYFYKEYSWEHQVISKIKELPGKNDDKDAWLWLMDFYAPVYCVDFGWAKNNLSILWNAENGILIVSSDFASGIIVSHSCGYLMENPNPKEIVYELELWGF